MPLVHPPHRLQHGQRSLPTQNLSPDRLGTPTEAPASMNFPRFLTLHDTQASRCMEEHLDVTAHRHQPPKPCPQDVLLPWDLTAVYTFNTAIGLHSTAKCIHNVQAWARIQHMLTSFPP